MASTPFIPPAMWESGTNQNSIPANDNALRFQISQSNVNNATTAQPGSPAEGDCYIIQSTHTGAQWSTFTPKDLAIYSGGTWYAFAPVAGNRVTVGGAVYVYTGTWTAASGGGGGGAAEDVTYDNTTSGLAATDVQEAIDELAAGGGSIVTCIPIACGDETTSATTGVAKVTFRMPFAMTLTAVRASVTTAPTGSTFVIDINESGSTILSTKLSIDASEKTSTTAATPPVISDTALADDAEITIDFDQVGSSVAGTGVKVYLIGTI